jgi:hypothetical protein
LGFLEDQIGNKILVHLHIQVLVSPGIKLSTFFFLCIYMFFFSTKAVCKKKKDLQLSPWKFLEYIYRNYSVTFVHLVNRLLAFEELGIS